MRIAIVLEPVDGVGKREGIQRALDALTWLDEQYLAENPDTPALYDAGVHWQRETNQHNEERFLSIGLVRKLGWGDCDDLACWRAAELRRRGEKSARAVVYAAQPGLWHVVVKRADGSVEDPSRKLGMVAY